MNAVLKRTLVILSVILMAEVLITGWTISGNHSAYAIDRRGQTPKMMAVVDLPYKPAVGIGITSKPATPEVIAELESVSREAMTDGWAPEEFYYDAGNEVEAISYTDVGNFNVSSGECISASEFQRNGIYFGDNGYSYTYYSERVLPGGGLDIPGRHVNDEGYICDVNGNLCIASDDLPKGTVMDIPFGTGTAVVYDCGSGSGNIDVYVSW